MSQKSNIALSAVLAAAVFTAACANSTNSSNFTNIASQNKSSPCDVTDSNQSRKMEIAEMRRKGCTEYRDSKGQVRWIEKSRVKSKEDVWKAPEKSGPAPAP